MMVRVDNDVLLYGYFDEAAVFQPTGTVAIAHAKGQHTLEVIADGTKLRYHVYLDGARVVADAPMQFGDGFVGITSCGGPHAFYSLTSGAPTPGQLAGLSASVMQQPYSVAVSEDFVYVLTRGDPPIQVWSKDGKLIRKIGSPTWEGRRIEVLPKLAPGQTVEWLLVELAPGRGLALLDRSTNVERNAGPRPPGAVAGAVCQLPNRPPAYVWVTDVKELAVQQIRKGDVERFPAPGLNKPTAVCSAGPLVYVADADMAVGRFETHVYDASDGFKHVKTFSSWLDPRSIAATPDGNLAYVGGLGYYETGGCVRVLKTDGSRVASAAMFPFGTVSRRGAVAVDNNGDIYVADPANDAVFIYPPDLREPDPVVTQTKDGVRIRWWSPIAQGGRIRFGTTRNGGGWRTIEARRDGEYWEADIRGLRPNTRYQYRFFPGPRMLPEPRESRRYTFVTAPTPGKRQAVEVRIVTAIYLNTIADGEHKWSIPEQGVVQKVRHELEKARLFYWRNSRCRFHLNISDYVVIRDTPAKVQGGWLDPGQVRRDLKPLLKERGRSLDDYDSMVSVWAEPGFDPNTDDELGAVGGGGLTPYGYSTFGISGRLAWLMVHEFNHQVDAFYDGAGSVKYWLNHPEYTIHPGRYGQHFDCNAYLSRLWRDDEYLTNDNFGLIVLYDDRDGDGMPDDDFRFPMDERAFGSDPGKADTDGDGLDDLGEFMAGTFSATDPNNRDTDGDRRPDGEDEWPLYATDPVVYSMISSQRGRGIDLLDPNSRYLRGSDPSGSGKPGFGTSMGDIWLIWGPYGLDAVLTLTSDEPMQIEIDFDWDNDGWFTGNDNHSFSFDTGALTASVEGTQVRKDGRNVVLTFPLEKLKPGETRDLAPGHKFGIRVRAVCGGRAVSAFDPWSLFVMELVR
jgi:DNA-binding beta-propeller fold protein YncE